MTTQLAKQDIEIKGGMLTLTRLSDAMEYARTIIKSGLAPDSFKSPESVLVAMQHGAELGLKPLASLQHIAVINGRPSLYGKALPGVIMPTGLMTEFDESFEGEGDGMSAVCRAKRRGVEKARTERFSVADAKRAELWGKSGPWRQYPKDMLRYKARARCLGSLFADVLCGMPVFEDYQDVQYDNPTGEIAPAPATPDPLMVDVVVTEPEPTPPEPEQISTPEEPEKEFVTDKMRENMFSVFKGMGVSRADVLACVELEDERDIGPDEMVFLREQYEAIHKGEKEVTEIFEPLKEKE